MTMPDIHDPIQELLISARRNQILDAATTVFAEKGFHRATIKEIARQAGIAELRDLYYQRVLAPTFAVGEQFFQAQSDQFRHVDMPLTLRAIASTVLGLLLLQLLGDQAIAERWEELPEVLTTLIFDGLKPHEEATVNE